ncbi:unnamed protein product, partial [Symbiodinium sp. CCMP2456]
TYLSRMVPGIMALNYGCQELCHLHGKVAISCAYLLGNAMGSRSNETYDRFSLPRPEVGQEYCLQALIECSSGSKAEVLDKLGRGRGLEED